MQLSASWRRCGGAAEGAPAIKSIGGRRQQRSGASLGGVACDSDGRVEEWLTSLPLRRCASAFATPSS